MYRDDDELFVRLFTRATEMNGDEIGYQELMVGNIIAQMFLLPILMSTTDVMSSYRLSTIAWTKT